MRARAPASSANLGPGFDTLALALGLYCEVEVKAAASFSLSTSGQGSDYPTTSEHFVARIVRQVMGHDKVDIRVHSDIPLGRGLGSSAAVAAAAAAAAGSDDPLRVAAEVDGHPENAAASVLGGLITATTVAGRPVANRLALDPALAFVVVVPDRRLPTREARAALPATVPHEDAAFNLGRMGLLLAGLADASKLRPEATEDRLHQTQRAPLFPESDRLIGGLVAAGAMAACWSGAGPSILSICNPGTVEQVVARAQAMVDEIGGTVLRLAPDLDGIVVTD